MQNLVVNRKIDSMGRIVIPKEYRSYYNINENDYLRVIPLPDGFALKKYSRLDSCKKLLQHITDLIFPYVNAEVFIADKDRIVAYSGKYKNKYLNSEISNNIRDSINRRESLFEKYRKKLFISNVDNICCTYINDTIISNSEEVGIIYIFKDESIVNDMDLKIIKIVSSFLSKYLEE